MAEVIFSARAIRDIEQIHAYIAKDSKRYADGQVRRIINAADLIGTFPRGGREVPEIELEKFREVIIGNYRVIYYLESEDRAEIIVVFHGRRRFPFGRISPRPREQKRRK